MNAPRFAPGAGLVAAPPTPGQPPSAAPPGFVAEWWPMPQIPSGGYNLNAGVWYRTMATLSGAAIPASASRIASELTAKGWAQVHVYGPGDQFPTDWPSPPTPPAGAKQTVYVEAQWTGGTQTLPASDTYKIWPVTILHYDIIEAELFAYHPSAQKPPPPIVNTPGQSSGSSGFNPLWALAAVSAAALGWEIYKHTRRGKERT